MMDKISRNMSSQVKFIDDLLDLSKLKIGKIKPNKMNVNVHSLVSFYKSPLHQLASNKGIEIHNNTPKEFRVTADMSLLAQVLQNLISNAIKFCGDGDIITIDGARDGRAEISVKDTGPGIAPDIMPDLFMQHIKATTLGSKGETGTGLGLPYCKDIIDAHEGEITVESELGKGTVFTITLPEQE